MLTYNEVVRSGVMTPSLASLLLTESPDVQKRFLSGIQWEDSVYRICLFYRALIQAYVIGAAMDKDCTVDELGYPAPLCRAIKSSWPLKDVKQKEKNKYEIFSFLNDAVMFLGEDGREFLSDFFDSYSQAAAPGNRSAYVLDAEDLLEIFRVFPLLACTEVDLNSMKFSFPSDLARPHGYRFSINCAPFMYFVQAQEGESESVVEYPTSQGMILVSARRGEKNGDLLFDLADLHTVKNAHVNSYRSIRRQAPKDEKLYQICRALGMDTDWYEMDDYLCNMAFLVRITELTKTVLIDFWENSDHPVLNAPSEDIYEKMEHMLCSDPDMCRSLTDLCKQIDEDNIDRVLYGLYIEFGVFKTMRALLKDTRDHSYGKELFEIYLDAFVKMNKEGKGGITAEQRAAYESDCSDNIKARLEKLKTIVPQEHPRYRKRERTITAEWRAFYILKAAGIHSDNLFADEEAILSIDDYYCMIKNPTTTLKSDLNEVLSLLIEMYGALMQVDADFDEKTLRREVLKIREKNKSLDTVELFDALCDLAARSDGNETIKRALGRDKICNVDKLKKMVKKIKNCFTIPSHDFTPAQILTKKYVFVSYAHSDKEIVTKYIQQWQKAGYRIVFDKRALETGTHWFEQVTEAMKHEDCAAVVYFASENSVISDAVCKELKQARAIAAQKFPSDDKKQKQYIITFNLSKRPFKIYADELSRNLEGNHDPREMENATDIYQLLGNGGDHYLEDGEAMERKLGLILKSENDEGFCEQRSYNNFELAVANFYAFLKFSDGNINGDQKYNWISDGEKLDDLFYNDVYEVSRCVYPLIASVKETKVKRDNIALMGYEILRNKGEDKRGTHYIFSSKRLIPDDYYCIPNYRTTGEDGIWMVNPLMINHHLFAPGEQE